ncbi:MAG: hypothetical protein KDA46_01400, partial [Parvularculaceae bacterium]|nr:hypothetical protein [Parvularculaceae bacterium]
MKVLKFVFATIACLMLSKPVLAEGMPAVGGPSGTQSTGLAPCRVGYLDASAVAPAPLGEKGNAAALRVRGVAVIDRKECDAEMSFGIEVLKGAARLGDTSALIRLEKMRLAKSPHAPSLGEIVSIEHSRAKVLNDRVSAWRLTKRIESGEATLLTREDYIDLLKI